MASSLVQFRTEDTSRIKAASICEQLGIDLPTYLRACIARLIQENGIPFSIVPGVSSCYSVPAYAGIPVTHRAYAPAFHVITGHCKTEQHGT